MVKENTAQHIFVVGGVASALGKGITAASLGLLLASRGLRVVMQKLDPYLNVDPGTMSPLQHGEVFVTADGAETDLDIGHYERFLDTELTSAANATSGQIYSSVIARERRGDYLGATVQVVPHVVDEIKTTMRAQARTNPDVIITEIGGTVGDIESLPFLEAARQVRRELGRGQAIVVHVSLVPYLAAAGEAKTKPTQHSVAQLRAIGMQPDVIVCRTDRPLPESMRAKISLMCDVEDNAVIVCPDVPSIYQVPGHIHDQQMDDVVLAMLGRTCPEPDLTAWNTMVESLVNPQGSVRIGMVGKYSELPDAYMSVLEALRAAGASESRRVEITWMPAEECADPARLQQWMEEVDGIVVPGGFGVRGIDGKIAALQYARENAKPALGICLGMQAMVIEAARNLLNLPLASSSEFDPDTPHPVISTMADQEEIVAGQADMGGTMRLGNYPAQLQPGSRIAEIYGAEQVTERHRHRYEVNPDYHAQLEAAGLHMSGLSPDGRLAEYVEYREHPFYIGTQAHPEFTSRPTRPHPLFRGLIQAAIRKDSRD